MSAYLLRNIYYDIPKFCMMSPYTIDKGRPKMYIACYYVAILHLHFTYSLTCAFYIQVTKNDDGGGWSEGTLNGNQGWFPSNYVKEIRHAKKTDSGNIDGIL